MRALKTHVVVVTAILGIVSHGFGMGLDLLQTEKFDLTLGGRAQLIGYAENVADPIRDNNRLFLFLKQGRLNVHGRVMDYKYNTEWAFAAEDINGSNTSLTLLDFAFDIPFPRVEGVWIKAGQFKIPYSRERIAYSGNLQFADRSLQNLGFGMGRDVGVAVHGQRGKTIGTFGVFTGGGRDVPQRFLPEVLGFPLVAARVGLNDGVDKDLYTVEQNDLNIKATQKAAYVNALYMKDTLIGHNTVFGVKTAEKSIMLNSNWNPYIAASPLVRGDLWQAGADAVLRIPLSDRTSWTGEVEVNQAEFSNRYGTVRLSGARAQTAVLYKKTEIGLRYSALVPDDAFKKTGVNITRKKVINEIVPAITYYFRGHDLKLILDAPVLLNAPVSIEKGPTPIGAYVLTEQPDQTQYVTAPNGELQHQTVTQVRLMLQVAF
jgi:hypothetical protein